MLRKIVAFVALCLTVMSLAAPAAFAQQDPKCSGDPQMCAQILELRKDLDAQKQLTVKADAEKGTAVKAESQDQQDKTAKMMALAATIAVALKLLISAAKGWTGFFKTDKGVAAIKAGTLILGFGAFVLTNIGFGIAWWQALIVAGGPPGAILVHELMDLVPVIQGKKKLADVPPSPDDPAPPAVA